jgi:serine phosphatase RsbU (regulator of sigma subunit)
LEHVNRVFWLRIAGLGEDRFASLFVATVTGRRLTYASAGHDFALLMKASGEHRHLDPTGVLIIAFRKGGR